MKSYLNLSGKEKRLFFEALKNVVYIKTLLIFNSFKKCSEKFPPTGTNKNHSQEDLKEIRNAIRRTNKVTFWKNKCLVNTLAARKMLNKRNIYSEAFLGLNKETDLRSLTAHAWVISNDVNIVPIEKGYTKVHQF